MIFGLGGKYCPSCSARMDVRVVTHQAVDTNVEPVVYHGVRHYTCPNGCATGIYDFSQAYVDDPIPGRRGWQPYATPPGDGPFDALMRIDLSMIIVVLGLVLGYALFMWGVVVSGNSLGGKIASAALLTLSALFILAHLTSRANGQDADGERSNGRPARA